MKKLHLTEPIYTYHIDFVGHVNNVIYIQWLENARVKLLEAMGVSILDLAKKERILPIITETNIKYKRPYYLNDQVKVEVWVSKIMNASAIFKMRFLNGKDQLCSEADQKVLFIDEATMRPSRKIAEFIDLFKQFYISE